MESKIEYKYLVSSTDHTIAARTEDGVRIGSISYSPKNCRITALTIQDGYRRMGFGSELLDRALKKMVECPEVSGNSYDSTVGFYRSHGAKEVCEPREHASLIPMSGRNKYYWELQKNKNMFFQEDSCYWD